MTFNCTKIVEFDVTKYRFDCDNMFLYVDKTLFDNNAILIGNKLQMQLNEDIILSLAVNKKLGKERGISLNGNDMLLSDQHLKDRLYAKDVHGIRVYVVNVLNNYDVQNIELILQSNSDYLKSQGVKIVHFISATETTVGFQCICTKPNVLKATTGLQVFGALFSSKQLKLHRVMSNKSQAYNTYNVYLVFKRTKGVCE